MPNLKGKRAQFKGYRQAVNPVANWAKESLET